MRLKPPPPSDEIRLALARQAVLTWGDAEATRLGPQLAMIADAMATLARIEVPGDVEPLAGDIYE